MKKTTSFIFGLLMLTSSIFAVSGPQSVSQAINTLQTTAQNLLGVMILICSLPLFVVFVISSIAFFVYKKDASKKWILYVAIVSLIISIGIIMVYLIIPTIISVLMGK
ncbi:MAG: hypothetical protein Q7S22_05240 [Candidatus Micrarchaeota archaeon]|nr:hypothetical protein [Candidatus Micrarchaeota archaeon]